VTTFAEKFAEADAIIMAALGDDLTLTPPTGAALAVKCVLAGDDANGENIRWADNVFGKMDTYSVAVTLIAADAPGLAKTWSATYAGQNYMISEILPRGDGTLSLILNPPTNTGAVQTGGDGWR